MFDLVTSLYTSVAFTGWKIEHGVPLENETEVWHSYSLSLSSFSDWFFDACPFGALVLKLGRWAACKLGTEGLAPSCDGHSIYFAHEVEMLSRHAGLSPQNYWLVFFNTRWAWLALEVIKGLRSLQNYLLVKVDPERRVRLELDSLCLQEVGSRSKWPWLATLTELLTTDTASSPLDPSWLTNFHAKVSECVVGLITMTLVRIWAMCQAFSDDLDGITLAFHLSLGTLDDWLKQRSSTCDTICVLIMTMWPAVKHLGRTISQLQSKTGIDGGHYQHKPYLLDFFPRELVKNAGEVAAAAARADLPTEQLLGVLRRELWQRPSRPARNVVRALLASLQVRPVGPGTERMVFLNMVYGERYIGYIPATLQRVGAFDLLPQFFMFCLDEASHTTCKEHHLLPDLCVRGDLDSTQNKFAITTVILHMGFGVLYLDFDLILFQDPRPAIFEAAARAEMAVSKDFGTECINIGVTYVKSHASTIDFMQRLLIWLWHHPYEFCQKAFAGMMGLEDLTRVSVAGPVVGALPRWTFLESTNQFVTSSVYGQAAQGWTGNIDRIVIFHFLDGIGGVDESSVQGQYVNLYDLFYKNPSLNLSDTSRPLWEQDEGVRRQLLRSRQLAIPNFVPPCTAIEFEAWPIWKKEQRAQVELAMAAEILPTSKESS